MRQSHKAALSFLVAVLLFSVFSFLAFSGVFDFIESEFYSRRKITAIEQRIEKGREAILEYHSSMLNKVATLVHDTAFEKVFQLNQDGNDIRTRENLFSRFRASEPDTIRLRILDSGLKRLQFSTDQNDLQRQFETGIVYKNFDEVDDPEPMNPGIAVGSEGQYLYDRKTNHICYVLPMTGADGLPEGYALLSIYAASLERFLQLRDLIRIQEKLVLIDSGLAVAVENGLSTPGLIEQISAQRGRGEGRRVLYMVNEAGIRYRLIGLDENDPALIVLVPEEILLLNPVLKLILLFSFFVTCFLLFFFFFNTRQDKELVVAERLQQLKLYFLHEIVSAVTDSKDGRIGTAFSAQKSIIKSNLLSGLKFKNDEERARIESSVEEVFDELIRISSSGVKISGTEPGGGAPRVANESGTSEIPDQNEESGSGEEPGDPEELEELDDLEEVDEHASGTEHGIGSVEDLDGVENLEEVEDLEEAGEPVEELEELGESEDAESMRIDDDNEEGGAEVEELGVPEELEPSAEDAEDAGIRAEKGLKTASVSDGTVTESEVNAGILVKSTALDTRETESPEDPESLELDGELEPVDEDEELPAREAGFQDSGLPEIPIDTVDGVGAIEIIAETDDGRFSLEVNFTDSHGTFEPEYLAGQKADIRKDGTTHAALEELECIDDTEEEPVDLDSLDETRTTGNAVSNVDDGDVEELPGVEDDAAAELEPVGDDGGGLYQSMLWTRSAQTSVPADNRKEGAISPDRADFRDVPVSILSIDDLELPDPKTESIVFSGGTFQINRKTFGQSSNSQDPELLALVRDLGMGETTASSAADNGEEEKNAEELEDRFPGAGSVLEMFNACGCARFSMAEDEPVVIEYAGCVKPWSDGSVPRDMLHDQAVAGKIIYGPIPERGIVEFGFLEFDGGAVIRSFCLMPIPEREQEYLACFFTSEGLTEGIVSSYYSKLRY